MIQRPDVGSAWGNLRDAYFEAYRATFRWPGKGITHKGAYDEAKDKLGHLLATMSEFYQSVQGLTASGFGGRLHDSKNAMMNYYNIAQGSYAQRNASKDAAERKECGAMTTLNFEMLLSTAHKVIIDALSPENYDAESTGAFPPAALPPNPKRDPADR